MTMSRVAMVAAAVALVVAAACSKKKETLDPMALGEYVETKNDSFPRIRYFETNLVSINDRCAVRKTKLNLKMAPVYVNGQPVGFC